MGEGVVVMVFINGKSYGFHCRKMVWFPLTENRMVSFDGQSYAVGGEHLHSTVLTGVRPGGRGA